MRSKNFRHLLRRILFKLGRWMPDKLYLSIHYYLTFGKALDWDNPKNFNEKLNWMKLNCRNPLFTVMADKYWVKPYVKQLIDEKYIVPCYGCWKRVDDIDFDKLPDRVFMKSNHDSDGGIIVDKVKGIDYEMLHRRFNRNRMEKKNWFWHLREWPYKHIESLILAEEYLDEGTGYELHDYKFYCFDGKPTYMYITNKGKVIHENFYDMDFRSVGISHGFERTTPEYDIPQNFDKMKELAARLSKGMPFIRIDFFNVNGHLYFGEFTFYDWGGIKQLQDEWEWKLGNLIKLPKNCSN